MKCVKCHSDDVNTSYVPEGDLINSSSYERVENEFVRSSEYDFCFQLKAKKEHLHFKCNECGYDWRESTMDTSDG